MASLFLENLDLGRNMLMDRPAQLNEVEAYKLNLILRVYLNQGLKLFKLYEAGIFPEEDWLLRAAEIKQVLNHTASRGTYARVRQKQIDEEMTNNKI